MPKKKPTKSTSKPKITTIGGYLKAQPEEVRTVLAKVVAAIEKAVPKATPTIAYQMPTWKLNGTALLHLGGWKAHWSLYPATPAVIAALGRFQGSFEVEKGTLRFPLEAKVPVALIAKVAKVRAAELAPSSTQNNPLKRTRTVTQGAATKKAATKLTGALPASVGRPALLALEAAGIRTLAEAARRNPMDLAKLHGVGKKALGILAEAISARRTRS